MVDYLAVTDDSHLIHEVDGWADVIRDDFYGIANMEAFFSGREFADAVFFTQPGDDDIWMADDESVACVGLAWVERQCFGAGVDYAAIIGCAADDCGHEAGGTILHAPGIPETEE